MPAMAYDVEVPVRPGMRVKNTPCVSLKTPTYIVFPSASAGNETLPNSVSGNVSFPAEADGKTMYVGVFSDTHGVFFTRIPGLTGTSTSYAIAGMPAGNYSPFAVIDMNADNTISIGDISN